MHAHMQSQLCTCCFQHLVKASGAAGLNRPVNRKREGCGGEGSIPLKTDLFCHRIIHGRRIQWLFHSIFLRLVDVYFVYRMCGLHGCTFIQLFKNGRNSRIEWISTAAECIASNYGGWLVWNGVSKNQWALCRRIRNTTNCVQQTVTMNKTRKWEW